jgi:phosphoribosylformylglycinamidine synthase
LVALLEMAFASGAALDLGVPAGIDPLAALFSEELGAVVAGRVSEHDADELRRARWAATTRGSSAPRGPSAQIRVIGGDGAVVLDRSRHELRASWSETTHRMQALRDDPACADEEHAVRIDPDAPAWSRSRFDPPVTPRRRSAGPRPRVAILREQGVNGQVEMAAAFDRAGFEAVDVHMTDLHAGLDLAGFRGLVACGGFSYGDVLGAGEGWAKSVLYNAAARAELEAFFARPDTFALGVCNGCQMMAALREIVPGAARWPRFVRNRSSSSRRGARWSRWRHHHRSSSATWSARGCRSSCRTARAAPPSARPATSTRWPRPGRWRCASSTATAARRPATRTTPTARPPASPA